MNPRGVGGEKMDLAGKKEEGVSSDTTECSPLLLLATERQRGLRRGRAEEGRKNQEGTEKTGEGVSGEWH